MNDLPVICIILLNWNGVDDTLECLASLRKVGYPRLRILLVDNGSTDDSVQRVRETYSEIEILALEENLLFAGGNNAGLAHLDDQDIDYIVFLNNDTVVDPDFLQPLLKRFGSEKKAGMVAPRILYHGSTKVWYDGGGVNLWTGRVAHRDIRKELSDLSTQAHATGYITGCCLMMPRALASELGGFDEAFSMYAEDVDLSLRISKEGYELWVEPDSIVYHKVSSSLGGAFSPKKLRRKGSSLLKLLGRHARWYQWPTIVVSQPLLLTWDFMHLAWYKLAKES